MILLIRLYKLMNLIGVAIVFMAIGAYLWLGGYPGFKFADFALGFPMLFLNVHLCSVYLQTKGAKK